MLMVNVLIASLNIDAGKSVKLIYTTGKPRFVQCIRLICKDCNGTGWQSCEKTLVVKLSKQQQNLLHAVVAGKRYDVDTDIIMQTRVGATTSAIACDSLSTYLIKLHAQ